MVYLTHITVLIYVASCAASVAHASDSTASGLYVGVGVGFANASVADFDEAFSSEVIAGYEMEKIGIEFAAAKIEESFLPNNDDSYIRASIGRALLYKKYAVDNKLTISPALGMAHANTYVILNQAEVDREVDTSLVWGIKLDVRARKHFSAGLDWLVYRYVAGSDLHTANFNFTYRI